MITHKIKYFVTLLIITVGIKRINSTVATFMTLMFERIEYLKIYFFEFTLKIDVRS